MSPGQQHASKMRGGIQKSIMTSYMCPLKREKELITKLTTCYLNTIFAFLFLRVYFRSLFSGRERTILCDRSGRKEIYQA